MSMQSTREQLTQLLDDQENKVVALSGKWGTGKLYLGANTERLHESKSKRSAIYFPFWSFGS